MKTPRRSTGSPFAAATPPPITEPDLDPIEEFRRNRPARPSAVEDRVFDMGPIHGISMREVPVDGRDDLEITLHCAAGAYTMHLRDVAEVLDVGIRRDTVARLTDDARRRVDKWRAFAAKHAKEISLYEQLKEKFG